MRGRRGAFGSVAGIAIVGALMAAPAAKAVIYPVTHTGDAGAGSLRDALFQAGNNTTDDTINISATGQINLTGALPNIGPATDGTLTINGPGANLLDVHRSTGGNYAVFGVTAGATATITGIKISGGLAPTDGGGIFNAGTLTLNAVEVSGNSATAGGGRGGGIHSITGASLTVRRSTIAGNTAGSDGGGGISISGGTATIERSTISGNTTTSLTAAGVLVNGTATIRSSTIANNTGNATLSVPKNLAVSGSGATASLHNTILADPHTPTPSETPPNCQTASLGTITSLGFNLADDATCNLAAAGDRPSTEPALAALGANGGPTRTHAIAMTSPAVDAGHLGLATGNIDQRGLTRPVNFTDVPDAAGSDGSDIGAYEVQLPPVVDPPVTQPDPVQPSPPAGNKKKCKKKKGKKRKQAAAAKKCKKKKKKKKK